MNGVASGARVAGTTPDERAARDRAAIIRAAHRLIGRHGVTTSVEEILRAAKVNRRTFYRHFPSKDALVLAMQQEAGRLVRDRLRAAVDGAADGRNAVVAWIGEYLTIGWDERRLRKGRTFIAAEVGAVAGISDALEEIHACHRAILAGAFARAGADGSLRAVRPERDAFAVHAVALRCVEMRSRDRLPRSYRAVKSDLIDLFVRQAVPEEAS